MMNNKKSDMQLSLEERAMLEGKQGLLKKKAMEFIVKYADVLGATELCKVSWATLFIGSQRYLDSYPSSQNYNEIFSQFYLNSDLPILLEAFSSEVKCQTCVAACDFSDHACSCSNPEFFKRNWEWLTATRNAGVNIIDTCTPYFVGWLPTYGEHFVSGESSVVLMGNSLFGARGNADGVEAAVCAAITGHIPKWGMHLSQNRFGTCIYIVDWQPETLMDWDLLGYTMGRMLPNNAVPVLVGTFRNPDITRLRQFFSALGTTSAAEMCHIVGLTPEAHTLDMALGGNKDVPRCRIDRENCSESYNLVSDQGSGSVDFVSIGCPHLNIYELRLVAEQLRDKQLKPGVEFQIWTTYAVKEMARVNGYLEVIQNSGAHLYCGSCPVVVGEKSFKGANSMAINGIKQAHSIRHQVTIPVYYGSLTQCVDAALTGYWQGEGWEKWRSSK